MRRLRCVRDSAAWLGVAILLATAGGAAAAPNEDPEAAATAVLNRLVDDLWERSDRFFHDGDYEATSRINRLVIRMDPQFVEAINTLAWLLRQGLGRPLEALALHHRAVRDNPESWEAYFDLGVYHMDLGDAHRRLNEDALARAEFALAVAPLLKVVELGAPSAKQHALAHAYEKAGRRADALQTWRGIVERFPDDQPARRNLERLEKEE